jgi:hypothetical protein
VVALLSSLRTVASAALSAAAAAAARARRGSGGGIFVTTVPPPGEAFRKADIKYCVMSVAVGELIFKPEGREEEELCETDI